MNFQDSFKQDIKYGDLILIPTTEYQPTYTKNDLRVTLFYGIFVREKFNQVLNLHFYYPGDITRKYFEEGKIPKVYSARCSFIKVDENNLPQAFLDSSEYQNYLKIKKCL
jgi:hypothetical protein